MKSIGMMLRQNIDVMLEAPHYKDWYKFTDTSTMSPAELVKNEDEFVKHC